MKKLMTMIATVATAFGLYAATVADTGTSFEGVTATGNPLVLADNTSKITELAAGDFWNLGDLTNEVLITEYVAGEEPSDHPSQYDEKVNNNYLALKTGSAALTRYALAMDEGDVKKYSVKDDDTLFFDSNVKLTGFEDAPEVTGAKLALWLSAVDTDASTSTVGETNLYVSVGGDPINCGPASALLDAWARVTIKAMPVTAGKDKMGFVVFVNQTAVSAVDAMSYAGVELTPQAQYYADAGQLFIANGTTIESVSFQGQGSVDDLVFTQTAPKFAEDAKVFPISWDADKVASVTVAESDDYTVDTSKSGVITVVYKDGKDYGEIEYSWVGKGNYLDGNDTVTATKGGSFKVGEDVELAKALFNAEKCETLDAAVEKANLADETCTIKLLDNENAYQAALTFENANDVVITLDLNGCTIVNENSEFATIGFVDMAAALVITDSSEAGTGIVKATEGDVIGETDSLVTLDGGTFEGSVWPDLVIASTDVKISYAGNEEDDGKPPFGYDMSEDLADYELAADDGLTYWTVQEKKPVVTAVTFTPPENAKIKKIVDGEGNEMPRVGDVFTLTVPGTYFATIEANDGYFYAEAPEAETVELARGATEYTLETPAPQKIVALINDTTPYASLAAAVAAAKSGDTVKLLESITGGDCFAIKASQCPGEGGLTIDLDDNTYTFNRSAKDGITIQTNDVVTIKNGTLAVAEGDKAFRDFVRVYGNLDTEVTFEGVTFDTTNMDKTWTEVENEGKENEKIIIRPTDAVRIEGGDVTFDGGIVDSGENCSYAVKFGNHAQAHYEMGTLKFTGDVYINGKVILMGGEFVEDAITGDIEYHYGANVHSTYEDGKATDGEGNALFAARVGEAMPEPGDENNDAGVLCKTVDDAQEALVEGKTLTFLADYELADDETFGGALAVIDGVQITLGKFKLTDKAGLLDVATAFTDEDVEKKDNEDGTFTYSVAAAPAEWPEEWADIPADDAVKAKFPAWRAGDGADADLETDVAKNAFLLNCTTAEVSDIKIEEITVLADGFVGIKFSVPGMFGFKRPISEMNGALFVEAGDALDKMTAQNVATWSATDNTGNFSIKANFVRVKIGFKAPETDAVQPPPAE